MFEHIVEALGLVATFETVLALAVGVAVGVVLGAVPGMTATMAVGLTLPFTFLLQPVTGILLLLGVYKGGIYGGSIPAILIKTPGTPASSCTVLDGYPMAQKGQAGRALDIALYASCTADLVSNIALIVFAAWLAKIALAFGPPEYFTLIVFSLTIIAGVAGDDLIKGCVSAAFGLILATIGLDLIFGTNRFVFGNTDLMSGLNFIPVLIGLFAMPEVIDYFGRKAAARAKVSSVGGTHATWADYKFCFPVIIKSSLIGVLMGAIPGIGGAPSAFLAYSEARRTSKHKKDFGKGAIEGVAASEAGNNGVAGATMIPLLALGIPGDVITAVILGAFMIQGLQPGPIMFQNNLSMIYALFMGIMLSSVFLFIIGKVGIRMFRRIADIPKSLMFPMVLVLCVFGSYAINNSMFDVAVMLATGFLGYFMLRFNIPAAPFLIAFILGPILENTFRQSLLMGGGDYAIFFRSAINWIFWALTVLSLGLIVYQTMIKRRSIPV